MGIYKIICCRVCGRGQCEIFKSFFFSSLQNLYENLPVSQMCLVQVDLLRGMQGGIKYLERLDLSQHRHEECKCFLGWGMKRSAVYTFSNDEVGRYRLEQFSATIGAVT